MTFRVQFVHIDVMRLCFVAASLFCFCFFLKKGEWKRWGRRKIHWPTTEHWGTSYPWNFCWNQVDSGLIFEACCLINIDFNFFQGHLDTKEYLNVLARWISCLFYVIPLLTMICAVVILCQQRVHLDCMNLLCFVNWYKCFCYSFDLLFRWQPDLNLLQVACGHFG